MDVRPASVFSIRQPSGTPGLFLDPSQRFGVEVANACGKAAVLLHDFSFRDPAVLSADQRKVMDQAMPGPMGMM